MGSYAECWLSTFYVGATKDQIDPGIIQLFRSSDKTMLSGTKKELMKQHIPFQLHRWFNDFEDDDQVTAVYYSETVKIIRDRLNFMGYTLDICKVVFMDWLNRDIEEYERYSKKLQ